jgi:hypothetical protein
VLRGRFADGDRTLRRGSNADTAEYEADGARLIIDWETHRILDATREPIPNPQSRIPNPESPIPGPVVVDLAQYMTLRTLIDALLRPSRIHFVNAPLLES